MHCFANHKNSSWVTSTFKADGMNAGHQNMSKTPVECMLEMVLFVFCGLKLKRMTTRIASQVRFPRWQNGLVVMNAKSLTTYYDDAEQENE